MKRLMSMLLAFCLLAGIGLGETVALEDAVDLEETVELEETADVTESVALPEDTSDPETWDGDDLPLAVPDGKEGAGEEDEPSPVPEELLPDEEDLEEEIIESRTLKYGDEGDDVLELQTRLKDLKYYTGNLSGRYREGTREAVKTFQGDYGLEKTGIADPETQNAIFTAKYRPLRYGNEGSEVKKLQTRLTELGYYKGKISGNFLGGTQKAVREFQEKNGLTASGAADVATQQALYSYGAIGRNDTADATPTPVPDLNAFLVDDEEHAANSGVVMPDEFISFSKTLKSGSSGSLVKQLQTRMTELGYYTGPVSGNFAKQTVRAVKTIQTQNGLKSTGIVDEETWNIIFNDNRIVMPDATPKPTPEPTPVPFAITVDVTNQVTTVYARDEKGEYTVPVRRMLCSTGTKSNPSDVGDWVLNGRHAKWCVFPRWGNSYARYWTRINASIAFHSVIYTAVSLDAMKTSSYKALGSRASHGCIRLTVEDAKWIYDNIGEGTVVSIREDLPSDPELRDALKLPSLKKGTSIPVETPVPTPEPDYEPTAKPELGNRRLRKGAEGPEVYWVQRRLAEEGYYTGYVGGKILAGTVNAIKAFQKANKIYASGEVNQQLVDLLAQLAETTPAPTETAAEIAEAVETIPGPEPTPGPENI